MLSSYDYKASTNMSFISPSESILLEKIVSENYTGEGCIVDAGSFLGYSASCLARGVLSSEKVHNNLDKKPIICIDRFIAYDQYICDLFLRNNIDVCFGESYLDLFLNNIKEYNNLIEVRCGDVMHIGNIKNQIEILMLDLCKTKEINRWVIFNWIRNLRPGSFIIQQDFHSPAIVWIAISMALMIDYLDIYTEQCEETCIFRVREKISAAAIDACLKIDPFEPQALDALRRLKMVFKTDPITLDLHESRILFGLGDRAEALRVFDQALTKYRLGCGPMKIKDWIAGTGAMIGHPSFLSGC